MDRYVQTFTLALALAAIALVALVSIPERHFPPVDCDAFGYTRQAQLFHDRGLAGIDTEAIPEVSRPLVDVAERSGIHSDRWHDAVAPQCHHYDTHSGKVILQYPPGTGYLMALFPPDRWPRALHMASLIAAAAVGALALGSARGSLGRLAAFALAVLGMWTVRTNPYSIWPGVPVAMAGALVLAAAIDTRRLLPFAAAGLLIGLLSAIRTASAFIAVCVILVLGIRWLMRRDPLHLQQAAAAAAGMALGAIPLMAAHLVNTGSVLRTTYSRFDTSAPEFSLDLLRRTAATYFGQPVPWNLTLYAAFAAISLGFILYGRRTALFAGLLVLMANAAYFLTHEPMNAYYMNTVAVFVTAMVAGVAVRQPAEREPVTAPPAFLARVGLAVAPLALVCALAWPPPFAPRLYHVDDAVRARLGDRTIVWSDSLSGYFVLDFGQYAAKLSYTDRATQDALIDGMSALGFRQLAFADHPSMSRAIEALRQRYRVEYVGQAYWRPVYEVVVEPGGGP